MKEKVEKKQTSKFLSRKFLITVTLVVMGFVLVITNKLDAMQFLIFAATNLGIYAAGNVVQKAVGKQEVE